MGIYLVIFLILFLRCPHRRAPLLLFFEQPHKRNRDICFDEELILTLHSRASRSCIRARQIFHKVIRVPESPPATSSRRTVPFLLAMQSGTAFPVCLPFRSIEYG